VKIATERCFVGGTAVGAYENRGEGEPRERLHLAIDGDARWGTLSIIIDQIEALSCRL
jgi:hypothetical protein